MLPPRALVTFRGDEATSLAAARTFLAEVPAERVAWVAGAGRSAPSADPDVGLPGRLAMVRAGRALGATFDAAVVALHGDWRPNDVAAAEGLVRGGGALVLCAPSGPCVAPAGAFATATWAAAVAGGRGRPGAFEARIDRLLALARAAGPAERFRPPPFVPAATPEQDQLVAVLAARLDAPGASVTVVTAPRGRGKSAALGRVAAATTRRVLVVTPSDSARDAVAAFTGAAPRLTWWPGAPPPPAGSLDVDAVLVDEAAQFPVGALRAWLDAAPDARFVFATTTHGYEGTGQGFALRFVASLPAWTVRPLHVERLVSPIRWAADDPVEAAVADALLLQPDAVVRGAGGEGRAVGAFEQPLAVTRPDPAALAADESLLRQVWSLLVSSHYRTTPDDLRVVLSAPNVRLHVARRGARVVGACVVALEGGFDAAEAAASAAGRATRRGHVLVDALGSHMGITDAAALRWVRSVRVAAAADERRGGVGRALVDDVHAAYGGAHGVDALGTVFGATPGLLAFRRAVGYDVVRFSPGRGARSGEPAVVLMRPLSVAGRAVFDEARRSFAREAAAQLTLLSVDDGRPLDDALVAALLRGVEGGEPRGSAAPRWEHDAYARRALERFVAGPSTFESVAGTVTAFVRANVARIGALPAAERAVISARVLAPLPWPDVAAAAGLGTTRAAMRLLRRAVAQLVRSAEGALEGGDPVLVD